MSNIAARNMFLNFNFERMHVLQTVVLRIVCELSGYEKLWVPINCHCCMRGNILCSFREKKKEATRKMWTSNHVCALDRFTVNYRTMGNNIYMCVSTVSCHIFYGNVIVVY